MFTCLLVYLFTCQLTNAQKPFSYFFAGNTLAPTLFTQETDTKTKIEVILSTDATLSKTSINSGLVSGYGFSGTTTAVPVNFSSSYLQSFKVTDGTNITDVALSVKQIKKRTAPFSLVFTSSVLLSNWAINTLGWVGQGLGDAEDILLDRSGATFVMAYSGSQNFLTFEMEALSIDVFSGLFTVEASPDGYEGTWKNVLIKDDCNNPFLQGKSAIKLLLPQKSQFVRFVLNRTAINQAVLLNRFTIASYSGEELGEFSASAIRFAQKSEWKLQSTVAKDYLHLIVPDNTTQWTIIIYDMNGRALKRAANLSRIPVDELSAGVYTLSVLSSESAQNLKFFKKHEY